MKAERIAGFAWDETNVEKLELHGLYPEDIEDLFDRDPILFHHPNHSNRWIALGFLPKPDDRFVLVSFELDEETRWVRVVTAFEPTNDKWWRLYAKTKNIKA